MFQSLISRAPVLTQARIRSAYGIAVTADVLQFALGPVGWAGADELIDIVAMIMISRAIGFHPLLLPTFALEFIPLADAIPAWTACVALVVASRKRQDAIAPVPATGQIIDV